MKFLKHITERNDNKVRKLISIFSNIPSGSPDSIATHILNMFNVIGIKPEHGNTTYLSGPMTHLPDDNWPVFIMAEKKLSGNVFNPAKPHGNIIKKAKGTFTWSDFMVEDIYSLLQCNKIIVLPGWSKSTGATVEVSIGQRILNTKPKTLYDSIGNDKYKMFIADVKEQYYKDGNNKGYNTIIEPMLLAKSESEAAKYVKSYTPPSSVREGFVDIIKNMISSIEEYTILDILKIIGYILDKNYSQGLNR